MKYSKENIEIIYHEDTDRYDEVVKDIEKKNSNSNKILVVSFLVILGLVFIPIMRYFMAGYHSDSDRIVFFIIVLALSIFIAFTVMLTLGSFIPQLRDKYVPLGLEDSFTISENSILDLIVDSTASGDYSITLVLNTGNSVVLRLALDYLDLEESLDLKDKAIIDFQKGLIAIPYK